MEEAGLKLQIKRKFGRSQAEIFLNGITVLTGISDQESRIKNLMQFLYTSLKVVVDYPKIISSDLDENLTRIAFALSVIVRKLPQYEILFPDIRGFNSGNLSDWIDLVDRIHLHLKTYHPDLLFEKGKFFFEEEEGKKQI
ncbi:MAG: hypothetical protein LUG51_07695 [Tannerellaceae bacterium]|nr:hypothetical protein [Tannerellaceae bacterium]